VGVPRRPAPPLAASGGRQRAPGPPFAALLITAPMVTAAAWCLGARWGAGPPGGCVVIEGSEGRQETAAVCIFPDTPAHGRGCKWGWSWTKSGLLSVQIEATKGRGRGAAGL